MRSLRARSRAGRRRSRRRSSGSRPRRPGRSSGVPGPIGRRRWFARFCRGATESSGLARAGQTARRDGAARRAWETMPCSRPREEETFDDSAPVRFLYRAGDKASEIYFVVSGSLDLVRDTPVGPQAAGQTSRRASSRARRRSSACPERRTRAPGTRRPFWVSRPSFSSRSPDRAPWLRHLRACLARRLASLNDYFQAFFPKEESTASKRSRKPQGRAVVAHAGGEVPIAHFRRSLRVGPLPVRRVRRGAKLPGRVAALSRGRRRATLSS